MLEASPFFQTPASVASLEQLRFSLDKVLETGHRLVQTVRDGKINFDELCDQFTNMDPGAIALELTRWVDQSDAKWIADRVKQIKYMFEFDKLTSATHAIQALAAKFNLQLRDTFNLQLFNNPQQIHRMPLESFTEDLLKSGQILHNLTSHQIEALTEFTNASDFVLWLRKETNNEPRGFRTLIDLAQITAGAGLDEIRIVDLIEKAVTGYEALIFGILEVKTVAGLLTLCEPLWKNLQANPNLPKSLKDAVGYKRWLEQVKTTHGSVEQSALDQARLIATSGTFILESETSRAKPAHLLDVGDVLFLEIEDESAEEAADDVADRTGRTVHIRRKYSYADLQELQNKLMLIAGQAYQRLSREAGVERFIRIFDQVTRLAHRYIKLRQLGTLIFDDMRCEIFCEENDKNDNESDSGSSLRVKFGLRQGILHSQRPVVESISQLITIFENCIRDWYVLSVQWERSWLLEINFE